MGKENLDQPTEPTEMIGPVNYPGPRSTYIGSYVIRYYGNSDVIVTLIETLSIDDEMRGRRRPEVKFSRASLLGMRKVVKTSSSLRRLNSGRFVVVAKT